MNPFMNMGQQMPLLQNFQMPQINQQQQQPIMPPMYPYLTYTATPHFNNQQQNTNQQNN